MAAFKLAKKAYAITLIGIFVAALLVTTLLVGCDGGDTDGGEGNDTSGLGTQFVSDGGAGGTLRIEPEKTEFSVGEIIDYKVIATDPRGQGISFIRIFCETEKGIAIIEPSSGGVAFEHTNINGIMSGKIGGVTPGSYLMECRGPQGFNLIARLSFRIVGEIPEGFDGFPGAAGGNLGGGQLVEPPNQDLTPRSAILVNILGEQTVQVDSFFNPDCDSDATTDDPEPFGPDFFLITLTNQNEGRVQVESVTFEVNDSRSVESEPILLDLIIGPGEETTVSGPFTETLGAGKTYATTNAPVLNGVWPVTFTIRGTFLGGGSFTTRVSLSIQVGPFDLC